MSWAKDSHNLILGIYRNYSHCIYILLRNGVSDCVWQGGGVA